MIALATEADLRTLGFDDVVKATTLQEAEALTKDHRFDIAVLDINLDGQSSIDLALRLHNEGTRIVLATGYERLDLPAPLENAPVLSKPYGRDALAAALE